MHKSCTISTKIDGVPPCDTPDPPVRSRGMPNKRLTRATTLDSLCDCTVVIKPIVMPDEPIVMPDEQKGLTWRPPVRLGSEVFATRRFHQETSSGLFDTSPAANRKTKVRGTSGFSEIDYKPHSSETAITPTYERGRLERTLGVLSKQHAQKI